MLLCWYSHVIRTRLMAPRRRRPNRSPRAHRRYTRAESAGITAVRAQVRDGLAGLVAFVNGASVDTGGWRTVRGCPWTPAEVDAFRDELREDLLCLLRVRLPNGRPRPPLSFGMGQDIVLTYRLHHGRVTVDSQSWDLADYLWWVFAEAIRSGDSTRLKRCAWRECHRFFLAARTTKRYCTDACQDAASNARRAANRARQRRYYTKTFHP